MSTTSKYSFWSLLQQQAITIPIIQRDYAQGRQTEKITEIRENLLADLYHALTHNKPLDFDFVYGSIENGELLPLDGQQRLTTLFLLHWYLAKCDGRDIEAKASFSKFTYRTRISANEFCHSLVFKNTNLPTSSDQSLSELIRDASWFHAAWEKDLTVRSMLTMLDAIDRYFRGTSGLFQVLTQSDLVSFQFISIKNFGLSDVLYIKMNARGKPLTDFENLKARFEQFLEKVHPEYKLEFTEKIDGDWTDLFWKYRHNQLIDGAFMRYLTFVTQMLYYFEAACNKETPAEFNPTLSFAFVEKVYASKANLVFLFQSLDYLAQLPDMDGFFSALFGPGHYTKGKVAYYEGSCNLFAACLNNEGFGIRERVLFFILLKQLAGSDQQMPDENVKDLLRVVRNLLSRVRQLIDVTYRSNLRIEQVPEQIWTISNSLVTGENVYDILASEASFEIKGSITADSLQFERTKARFIHVHPECKEDVLRLEDHPMLRGSIHNVPLDAPAIQTYATAMEEIWSTKNDSLIIRALLTCGDFNVSPGGSKLGFKFYLGNKDNWYTILTNVNQRIQKVLPLFLDAFLAIQKGSPVEKLQHLITTYLSEKKERDWFFYFVKHPQLTGTSNNLFTWGGLFSIRLLTGNTLQAYHINPYVRAVALQLNDTSICHVNDCYGQYAWESPLVLQNGFRLFCEESGWRITIPEGGAIPSSISKKYKLQALSDNSDYLLIETEEKDRIEIGVAFCQDLVKALERMKTLSKV